MACKKKMPLELEEIKRKVKKLQYLTEQKKQTKKTFQQSMDNVARWGLHLWPCPTNKEPRNSIREPLMRAKHHLVSETCTAPGRSRCHPHLMNPNILFFFFRSLTKKKPTFDPMHSGTRPSLVPMLGRPIAPKGTWLLFTSQVVV